MPKIPPQITNQSLQNAARATATAGRRAVPTPPPPPAALSAQARQPKRLNTFTGIKPQIITAPAAGARAASAFYASGSVKHNPAFARGVFGFATLSHANALIGQQPVRGKSTQIIPADLKAPDGNVLYDTMDKLLTPEQARAKAGALGDDVSQPAKEQILQGKKNMPNMHGLPDRVLRGSPGDYDGPYQQLTANTPASTLQESDARLEKYEPVISRMSDTGELQIRYHATPHTERLNAKLVEYAGGIEQLATLLKGEIKEKDGVVYVPSTTVTHTSAVVTGQDRKTGEKIACTGQAGMGRVEGRPSQDGQSLTMIMPDKMPIFPLIFVTGGIDLKAAPEAMRLMVYGHGATTGTYRGRTAHQKGTANTCISYPSVIGAEGQAVPVPGFNISPDGRRPIAWNQMNMHDNIGHFSEDVRVLTSTHPAHVPEHCVENLKNAADRLHNAEAVLELKIKYDMERNGGARSEALKLEGIGLKMSQNVRDIGQETLARQGETRHPPAGLDMPD